MKAFKKFSILTLIVLVILTIVIFLPKKIDNNTYYKNLKELNYSVSYKDAFPNEMLRYVVLTCVVDNVCNNIDEELKIVILILMIINLNLIFILMKIDNIM